MLFADHRFPASEAPPAPVNGKHVIECRVYQRHPCAVEIACQPVAARTEDDPVWPGQIKNLSQRGAGLMLGRRFEPGAALAIEVHACDDTYLARVIHVRQQGPGSWLHGCEFVSKLSEDELARLVDSPPSPAIEQVPAANKEIRAVKRHRAGGVAYWRHVGTSSAKRDCPIHDVSSLGMALRLPGPIHLGAVLDIDLCAGPEPIATVQARTVNVSRQKDDAWIVGCAFVEEIRADDLLQLHEEARRSRGAELAATYPCPVNVVCVASSSADDVPTMARAINVAPGAVSVVMPQHLPIGSVFELSLAHAGASRGQFLLRVVMATEHWTAGWMHGCEFATQLADEQLRALMVKDAVA